MTSSEPQRSDFEHTVDFLEAYEAYADAQVASDGEVLRRAARYADDSIRAVDLQLTRIHDVMAEIDQSDWLFQVYIEIEFFIMSLLRLRRSALLAKQASSVAIRESIDDAIKAFDDSTPGLVRLRNVLQHFDAYGVDSGRDQSIGRRYLEVSSLTNDSLTWLDTTLTYSSSQTAAYVLYDAVISVRNEHVNQENS